MIERGMSRESIRLSFRPAQPVKKVEVAGDFSGWKPLEMRKEPEGSFSRNVQTGGLACEYKFIVDGAWITDPDNNRRAANPFGSFNSIAPPATEETAGARSQYPTSASQTGGAQMGAAKTGGSQMGGSQAGRSPVGGAKPGGSQQSPSDTSKSKGRKER